MAQPYRRRLIPLIALACLAGCKDGSDYQFSDPPSDIRTSFQRFVDSKAPALLAQAERHGYHLAGPEDDGLGVEARLHPAHARDRERGIYQGTVWVWLHEPHQPDGFAMPMVFSFDLARMAPDTTWYLLTRDGYIHESSQSPSLPADLHMAVRNLFEHRMELLDWHEIIFAEPDAASSP